MYIPSSGGWSGGAKVFCILHHRGVRLILAYSWARPAILVAALIAGEKCDGFLWEKKKNGQIKMMTSMRMLILSYAIQLVIPNVCTKFQNSRSSSWEVCDKKFYLWKRKLHKYWHISMRMLNLSYTIQVIPNVYTKFQGMVGWCEGIVYLTSLGRPTDIGLQLGKASYPCSR